MELSQRARVRAGDHDEFGVLFCEHARAVYNHAFRLTGESAIIQAFTARAGELPK